RLLRSEQAHRRRAVAVVPLCHRGHRLEEIAPGRVVEGGDRRAHTLRLAGPARPWGRGAPGREGQAATHPDHRAAGPTPSRDAHARRLAAMINAGGGSGGGAPPLPPSSGTKGTGGGARPPLPPSSGTKGPDGAAP